MEKLTYQQLLEAGVHFGHLRKKWNPKMAPYIFAEKKGIHLIDLNKTLSCMEEAANALKQIAHSGKRILFVATKKQAKDIVAEAAKKVNMPYVTERWLGGMLTNFSTIRKSIKKMHSIEKMLSDESFEGLTKKEKLTLSREKEKMEKVLAGIAPLGRIPSAIFVVDVNHEHIALAESSKLNITTFGMVDTNSDPNKVDFAIPANDDSAKSIAIITSYLVQAIQEGLEDRKKERDQMEAEQEDMKDMPEAERMEKELAMENEEEGGKSKGGKKRFKNFRKPVNEKTR